MLLVVSFILVFCGSTHAEPANVPVLNQCKAIVPPKRDGYPNLVPPVVWDSNRTQFEPVEIKLAFDIWDIHRVEDSTQTACILTSFSVFWTDPRLEEFCEYNATLRDDYGLVRFNQKRFLTSVFQTELLNMSFRWKLHGNY